jgi:Cu(I)/Ag(I) efflux system membrane fusion protein
VAEVRLRFLALLVIAIAVVSMWPRLRNVWDRVWHAGGHVAASVAGDVEYFCPMDPGVLSQWPAICPICNMDLVPRRKHEAQLLPEGVIARMQLSPYRIQLAGIRTDEVVRRPLMYEIPAAGTLVADDSDAIWFDAPLSAADFPLLSSGPADTTVSTEQRSAAATARVVSSEGEQTSRSGEPRVRIELKEQSEGFAAGMLVHAVIHIPAGENGNGPVLAVPESAVVDHGDQRLVFVESMPGQFDAVPVTLGRRCGDEFPVVSGLDEGQRIASTGAFLIDAETRLNPNLAVAYFGANQASSTSRAPEIRVTTSKPQPTPSLSPEDAALAARQKICPVTELPLDSMGGPIVMTVEGRKVFLCCKGCEGKLKADPAKYLAKLPAP